MSEHTRRRRWLGRGLIGASALALPLTASFSYAQVPDAPIPPEASEVPAPPMPPMPPMPGQRQVRTIITHGDGDAEGGAPQVRTFVMRHGPGEAADGDVPAGQQRREFRVMTQGDPNDPEFQARMEQFGKDMEKWGEQYGERYAAQAEAMAAQAEAHAGHAMAMANAAPRVEMNCDSDQPTQVTRSDDGRQRVVICQRNITRMAGNSIRAARDSIAHNREISEAVRADVLQELDEEIERIEHEND